MTQGAAGMTRGAVGAAGADASNGSPWTAPVRSGALLFARYAFAPNRLGLCGPEDWRAMLELSEASTDVEATGEGAAQRRSELERGLRELAIGFEGAFPYLQLIAASHGIADPLDRRVVEAYWIGSPLSDGVDAAAMARSMEMRFRGGMPAAEWPWIADKPAAGARPTHAFHVLDIFPRLGTTRGGDIGDAIGLMEACRIRWGSVVEVGATRLVVRSRPLEMVDGRLRLGAGRLETVHRWPAAASLEAALSVGDVVSLHWDWACEVLTPERHAALATRTRSQLELTNTTL